MLIRFETVDTRRVGIPLIRLRAQYVVFFFDLAADLTGLRILEVVFFLKFYFHRFCLFLRGFRGSYIL